MSKRLISALAKENYAKAESDTSVRFTTHLIYSWRNLWVLSTNLHAGDTRHFKTCLWCVSLVKPTARQIRKHRKDAKHNRKS